MKKMQYWEKIEEKIKTIEKTEKIEIETTIEIGETKWIKIFIVNIRGKEEKEWWMVFMDKKKNRIIELDIHEIGKVKQRYV
jgi:hypothetical protein